MSSLNASPPDNAVSREIASAVVTASGKPVAFQRSQAVAALQRGQEITYHDVRLVRAAGGVKAVGADGADIGSDQAFWFAWSQFHQQTALWPE